VQSPSPETTTAEDKKEDTEEPISDVVEEQVGSGEVEPVPTPAVGGEVEHPAEEVTEEGGIEKVDEDLQELKVEGQPEEKSIESTEAPTAEETQAAEAETDDAPKEVSSSTPQVTEETTKSESEPAPLIAEPRKQERAENPTFTLETVGNKYNTGNFW
jgi:hypothetical protein